MVKETSFVYTTKKMRLSHVVKLTDLPQVAMCACSVMHMDSRNVAELVAGHIARSAST
jgi:hypothetical protein